MEADEVYSTLNDKISDLQSQVGDNSSRFDALRSDLGDLKSAVVDLKSSSGGSTGDLKSAIDRLQSDLSSLKDTVAALQQQVGQKAQSGDQQTQGLFDQMKKIEESNAAAERKYQEQQGIVGKLSAQAEEAGKMIGNWPQTAGDMVRKAVDDGKKEILSTWEDSKKEILGSISGLTTPIIKDAMTDLKSELKSMIFDEVKSAEADDKPKYLQMTEAEFEARVTKIATLVEANTPR